MLLRWKGHLTLFFESRANVPDVGEYQHFSRRVCTVSAVLVFELLCVSYKLTREFVCERLDKNKKKKKAQQRKLN